MRELIEIIRGSDTLLLDFDGPVCAVFSGYPVTEVTLHLRQMLADQGISLPPKFDSNRDPLQVLRWVDRHHPAYVESLDDALTNAEIAAVQMARPTEHAASVIEAASRTNRKVGVVSNNAAAAIRRYLADSGLDTSIATVVGRAYAKPALLKPDPYSVARAAEALGRSPDSCVLVGDSAADMKASRLAGVHPVGYAKTPHREPVLYGEGAEFVVHDMARVTQALLAA